MKMHPLKTLSLTLIILATSTFSQDESTMPQPDATQPIANSEQALSDVGLVSEAEVDGKIIGLILPFETKKANPTGLAAMGGGAVNDQWLNDDRRNDIELFTKGFLSRMKDYSLAETNQELLNKNMEEFALAMTGAADSEYQLEAGRWKGVNYFVTGRMEVLDALEKVIYLDVYDVQTKEKFTVVSGPRGKQFDENNVMIAQDLIDNLATSFAAKEAQQRTLLTKIQEDQSRMNNFDPSYRLLLKYIGATYIIGGLIGLDHTFRSNFARGETLSGIGNFTLSALFLGLGGVSFWASSLEGAQYSKNEAAYNAHVKEYNQKYGQTFEEM
jgi:hypothetical protein